MASAKFLLRRAMACARLARETEDEECRERCLRLERLYLQMADAEGAPGAPDLSDDRTTLHS